MIVLLALLTASCSGNSGSTTSEDRRDTQDDRGGFQSDSQNSQGFWQETDSPQNFDQNRAIAITTSGEHTCALLQTGTIKCWGDNTRGQLGNDTTDSSSVPVEVLDITDATQITTSGGHNCALRQTGTIKCWGDNTRGQLGNGTTDRSSVPVEVLNIADATQITTSYYHNCALRQTGTIKCWGANWAGQLGNAQSTGDWYDRSADSSVPVEVLGITDATQITTGQAHTCALLQTGNITCWGNNEYGQLGSGQTSSSYEVPVEVLGITDATQITTNDDHTCALLQTGTIKCWGNNTSGQLGNGQSTGDWYDRSADSSVPVEVLGITDATQITTSDYHTCALLQTGNIKCWGNNTSGQLGNGQRGDDWQDNSADSSVPVEVLGITDATQITAGDDHTCALQQAGTIKCWGDNSSGELGNGTETTSSVPVEVLGINDATQITTSGEHTCALLQTGTIKCWGSNEYGQLGSGQTSSSYEVPVEVLGITDATQITTSGEHACALLQTGNIKCWGSNFYGQLGNGQSRRDADSSVPVEVLGVNDATQITTSDYHACALLQTGNIKCWGNNSSGQLGNGQSGDEAHSPVPVEVLGVNDATQITTGWEHSCALLQTGNIKCWGDNSSGQLGNGQSGDEAHSPVPVEVLGVNDATQITTGWEHSCALLQTGNIKCWGDNSSGQLGNGQSGDEAHSPVPVEVLGVNDATQITTGSGHTCALRQTGTIKCWGSGGSGQLGDGQSGDEAHSPVAVEVLGITDATAITAGTFHTCALLQTGTIKCWGSNRYGRLGNGQMSSAEPTANTPEIATTTTQVVATTAQAPTTAEAQATLENQPDVQFGRDADSPVPVEVLGITDATQITTSDDHTCALLQTGTIKCWGSNAYGQLGNGQSRRDADSSVPVEVLGITDATQITTGDDHTCALLQTGTIKCWGSNVYGQMGNDLSLPQNVVGFGG